MSRILLVDDDKELCQLLQEFLQLESFDVDVCHDGQSALTRALNHYYDVIVLDVMMPKLNGFDTLRELRNESNTPVLMMTARGEEIDRIVGFEMGADDYLPKPCSPRELVARLKAIIRRVGLESGGETCQPTESDHLVVADLEMFSGAHRVLCDQTSLELTHTEFSLLQQLMQQPGSLVSKEELTRKALNKKLGPYDRSIDMHMSNLRRKLGPYSSGQARIKTVRGMGYLLLLPEGES
ncbi:MAG: response regulator transcription factor [Motiliproteus sp.]|nr:response regulator transcription factor [Motiliproteus sp.]MCW9051338.1 response regulator transcription factor [Motiliproteus sp.]